MRLSLEGDAHLLGRLAQGSLVGMDVSGMEGVDVNWGTLVAWLLASSPGATTVLAFSSLGAPGRCAYRKISLPTGGKNIIPPVLNLPVTPFLFLVYICPLSTATLRERIW